MNREAPWYTEKATEFLEKYLQSINKPIVLEFGCGASTIWLSYKVGFLVAIEHNSEWLYKIKNHINQQKVQLIYHQATQINDSDLVDKPYTPIINGLPHNYFDAILIDGRNRIECFRESDKLLKKGGLILLDNSEREELQEAFELGQKYTTCHNFVQVGPDKYGFETEGWTTSIWIK